MPQIAPELCGAHLLVLPTASFITSTDHQIEDFNEFRVFVSDAGDTRIERSRG